MRETHLNKPALPARAIEPTAEERRASTRPSVDEMSEWSFPASDPPATWTWDVERPARGLPVAAPASGTVVVGYDGSPPAQRSLERAATFVGASGRLILVTASPSSDSQGLMSEPLLDRAASWIIVGITLSTGGWLRFQMQENWSMVSPCCSAIGRIASIF